MPPDAIIPDSRSIIPLLFESGYALDGDITTSQSTPLDTSKLQKELGQTTNEFFSPVHFIFGWFYFFVTYCRGHLFIIF